MPDVRILTFCGSLRAASVNAATMRAAVANAPDGVEFDDEFDIGEIPLYHVDVEAAGLPPTVDELHRRMKLADGLLIFTPEYNGSFPAVTKNVIDWLTRPPKSWEGRGVTMVVTTPGRRGGESLRRHFDQIMGYFQVKNYPALGIGSYGDLLDDGEIVDKATIERLRGFVAEFADHCVAEEERD